MLYHSSCFFIIVKSILRNPHCRGVNEPPRRVLDEVRKPLVGLFSDLGKLASTYTAMRGRGVHLAFFTAPPASPAVWLFQLD